MFLFETQIYISLMSKKFFIAGILSLCVISASSNPLESNSPVEAPQSEQTLQGGQTEMLTSEPDSKEVATVQESPVAKKMTREQKAANAKENDSLGLAITIIAMSVVLGALIVLSILFLIFGKMSELILASKKKKAKVDRDAPDAHDDHDVDSGEAIAAVAMALAEHFEQAHDLEDTILTIRRMRKSYSPWNSKIYNMTQRPEPHHNNPSHSAFTLRKK